MPQQLLLHGLQLKSVSTRRSAEVILHQLTPTATCRLAAQMEALGGGGEVDPSMPLPEGVSGFMNDLMQSLLSKDVLYGSMREIGEKYPQWLQDHRCADGDLAWVQRVWCCLGCGCRGTGEVCLQDHLSGCLQVM